MNELWFSSRLHAGTRLRSKANSHPRTAAAAFDESAQPQSDFAGAFKIFHALIT
jgi:hypothetical protein